MPENEAENEEGDLDERAQAGLDHLQAAALEMIEGARAFLDVMEDFVGDREKLSDTLEVFGSLAENLTKRPGGRGSSGSASSGRGSGDDPVQHISVS